MSGIRVLNEQDINCKERLKSANKLRPRRTINLAQHPSEFGENDR